MKRGRLNKIEQALIDAMETAKQYCQGELEMNYQDWHEEKHLNGWYATDYRRKDGISYSIEENGYDEKPLINDELIEKGNVDIDRCFAKCHVYVCG